MSPDQAEQLIIAKEYKFLDASKRSATQYIVQGKFV
jgi:hypothetical protein